jgi:hypothetical protein
MITNTSTLVKNGKEVPETNFHCAKKRISRDETKIINEAFQRKTRVSVAGYTCYYHDSTIASIVDCPKFEETQQPLSSSVI